MLANWKLQIQNWKLKSLHNEKGFTLVETIIYIGIISIFFISIANFSITMISTAQKVKIQHEVQQNARFAMERMVREIRSADDINAGASTFAVHPGVLSIAHDTGSLDPTIFDLDNGSIRIKQGVGNPVVITSSTVNVTNLIFTDLSVAGRTKNIHIALTIEWRDSTNLPFDTVYTTQTSVVVIEEEG